MGSFFLDTVRVALHCVDVRTVSPSCLFKFGFNYQYFSLNLHPLFFHAIFEQSLQLVVFAVPVTPILHYAILWDMPGCVDANIRQQVSLSTEDAKGAVASSGCPKLLSIKHVVLVSPAWHVNRGVQGLHTCSTTSGLSYTPVLFDFPGTNETLYMMLGSLLAFSNMSVIESFFSR